MGPLKFILPLLKLEKTELIHFYAYFQANIIRDVRFVFRKKIWGTKIKG